MNQQDTNDDAPKTPWQDFFSLSYDQAHPDMIDNAIRSNVRIAGTNLWVLMFAIAIASIGLNVNSTAVIIGAMLISPLMSPIVGMGYGAAVGDIRLIRLSLRNMSAFIIISILTSSLYFLITPLEEAQSELLARTTPTLWDVLIAFFGGSAGIIAATRKEISNTIPGVAIATALMPPLCTAGYGLAHLNWEYFFGAFYLFTINCVFIAFATLLFCKLLKLPRRGLVTDSARKLHRLIISLVILVVMLPSGFLAASLVKKELFNTTVSNAISQIQQEEEFYVLRSTIDHQSKTINLIINGQGDGQLITQKLTQTLTTLGVKDPQVTILYAGGDNSDLIAKQASSKSALTPQNQAAELALQQESIKNSIKQADKQLSQAVVQEILVQYPTIDSLQISQGWQWQDAQDAASSPTAITLVTLITDEPPTAAEQDRLKAWLAQRLGKKSVELQIQPAPSKTQKPSTKSDSEEETAAP